MFRWGEVPRSYLLGVNVQSFPKIPLKEEKTWAETGVWSAVVALRVSVDTCLWLQRPRCFPPPPPPLPPISKELPVFWLLKTFALPETGGWGQYKTPSHPQNWLPLWPQKCLGPQPKVPSRKVKLTQMLSASPYLQTVVSVGNRSCGSGVLVVYQSIFIDLPEFGGWEVV